MPSVSSSTSECPVQGRESSFGGGEMDDLMRRISDSLRLKATGKQSRVSAHSRGLHRSMPYTLPTPKKCLNVLKCQEQCKYKQKRSCEKSCCDDPRELLQELLRDRSLIAEAVKRLHYKLETLADRLAPSHAT
ncbi:uncharacterized protein [Diadema antillarum]|uniref:uncharacterized protein n=1 Tax=Diadema antillarum TaxID=105358 RepID=UPI003A886D7B